MSLRRRSSILLSAAAIAAASIACLTTYNPYRWTPKLEAPPVEPRPDGCHVDVFEDGERVPRPHTDIGTVVLEWPQSKIKEQGPEGAIKTLKSAACETGAFIIKDMRALPAGINGLVYEATLATLLGDDGQPLNLRRPDAGPAAP
jgi:hypothetical protein